MDTATPLTAPAALSQEPETIPVLARWVGSWQISLRRRVLSVPELARSYDLAAPGWGRTLDRLGVPGAYEGLLGRLLAEDPLTGSGDEPLRVLDCGTGTGALSLALAGALPQPLRLDAVDIAPKMLARAGRNFVEAGLAAALRRADVRRLPYDDGAFDLVMSAHLLEHLAEPGPALKEMVRVLRPGGRLIACLTRRSALGAYVQLKWRTHRVSPGEAEAWLGNAGLAEVRSLAVGRRGLCRHLSLACVGRKPL